MNYALYGFVIIDYLFSFRKKVRNKTNIIYGGIVLGLIYLAMCYNGGTTGFGFDWYPYDLMTNMAHYSGLLAGVIMSLVIKICKIQGEKIKGS